MIKRYRITVNDEAYMVSIEPISVDLSASDGAPRVAAPAPKVSGAPTPAPKPAAAKPAASAPAAKAKLPASAAKATVPASEVKPAVTGSKRTVTAPLPGNMWKVLVTSGQMVKKGDVMFIIEAMKMENEIFAPCDGTIQTVSVSEGTAVNTGDSLCVID